MARLIDADKLPYEKQVMSYDDEWCLKVSEIESAPTVDAVEVVHGRWEQLGEADYKCSECGFRFTSGDPISMFRFCRCGAKMDGVLDG